MSGIALMLVPAGIIGLIGAALGVRDLKRKDAVAMQRGLTAVPWRYGKTDETDAP